MGDGPELGELARRAQQGDRGARDELLRELYRVVRKQVYFLVGGGPMAEDAVQETMIALHRALPGFRGDASPRTWAITIAARTARRQRRRERRHLPPVEPDVEIPTFDVDTAAQAELVLLRKVLARLTPRKRDAFVLMAIFELTADEAARALGTFSATAASRYRHARAELEAHLEKFDESRAVPATKVKGTVS
jgi:RNA polymerase sigma-70 factor (ECF subfamily)